MTDTVTLKPCPFCGGEANADGHIKFSQPLNDTWWPGEVPITEAFYVNCVRCGAVSRSGIVGGYQSRDEAITAWNTRSSSTASSAATLNVPTAVMAEGERKEAVRAAAALLAPYSADPAGTPTRDALVFLNAAINEAAAAHFAALAASSHPASAGDEAREALAFIDKFFEPWGSWKTVWWESEVSGDAAFSADNALKHVANILRRALSATPAQEVDETERLRAENARLREHIAATANEINIVGSAYDDAIKALDRLVAQTKANARAALAPEGDAR